MSETEKIENVEGTPKQDEATLREAEKHEEAKLKAKYPQVMRPGGSLFLQKRLHRGQKYFDSGDYNMAKAKDQKIRPPVAPPIATPQSATTGDEIPTPDAVLNRKTSLVQSKLATGLS